MAIEFTRQTSLMNLVNQHVQVCSHVRETQCRIDKSDALKTLIFSLRDRRTKVLKYNMITVHFVTILTKPILIFS